jgi:Kef-type K+ transport system membrane component KefB
MNFISLAGIFVFAAAFAVFAKNIKQPILVGYIFAGIALVLLHGITDISFLEDFGKVGVALLLPL